MKSLPLLLTITAMSGLSAPAVAQTPPFDELETAPFETPMPGFPPPPHMHSFAEAAMRDFMLRLYPPELVMQNSARLQLSDAQKTTIKQVIKAAQADSLDIKWDLREQSDALFKLLSTHPVDEKIALKQAGKVMALEEKVKTIHLSMLIRIKNSLTPDQQQMLQRTMPPGPPHIQWLREPPGE